MLLVYQSPTMIITQEQSSPVITNIVAAPSRFKIKASAKAFRILSGFYSEPILAIPRELGANAWDSHVKAGNTKTPFLVHAPNTLEPWFSVRDFGTGLSPEDVDKIYTTYFESTKTSDNDSDGCMGLGSKTPFNYADNFTVTSYFGGKKHVYNCFIDSEGAPNIMHMATEDSTEHPGLEIKFGVKMSDISMWVDKITRAYAPFRNRPKIVGANITFPDREYMYQGKTWAYRKSEGWNSQRGTNAFMGNYCYPVSESALRNALYNEADYSKLNSILSHGHLDLFFNIGDLEVAPNKEQLQYEDDNATTKNIIAAARQALKELCEMVIAKLEVPTSRWEAMKLHQKYNSYNSEYYHLRSFIGDIPIIFNGETIGSSSESVTSVHAKTGIVSGQVAIAHPFQVHFLDTLYGRIKRTGTYHADNTGHKVVFFYTNGETIKNARLRHYLATEFQGKNKPIPRCYIITDASPKASFFQKHAAHFGWDKADMIEIEALPKPPPAARAKKTTSTDEIFYFQTDSLYRNGDSRKTPNVYWMKRGETIDSTKTYYYVDFLYYDPAVKGANISSSMIADYFKVAIDNNLLGGEKVIFGINVKNKRLLRTGKWVNVIDLVTKHVAKHKKDFENELYLANFGEKLRAFDELNRQLTRNNDFINRIDSADTKATFKEFLDAYKKYVLKEVYSFQDAFYTQLGITAKNHGTAPIDVVALKKLVEDRYMGIFSMLDNYGYGHGPKLAKLVNFIDKNS